MSGVLEPGEATSEADKFRQGYHQGYGWQFEKKKKFLSVSLSEALRNFFLLFLETPYIAVYYLLSKHSLFAWR